MDEIKCVIKVIEEVQFRLFGNGIKIENATLKEYILDTNLNSTEVDGFFQDVKILSRSSPGGTLSCGSRVGDFRLDKELQACKNRPLSKI